MNAWVATELKAVGPTRVGLLANVCDAFYAEGIDILAIGAYDKDGMAEFLMITSDNDLAEDKLAGMGMDVTASQVVCVELASAPGALRPVARACADAGINISQIHATTAADSSKALAVLKVGDAEAVARMVSGL